MSRTTEERLALKERGKPSQDLPNSKTLIIGEETRITRAELRAGILNPTTWPKVFLENNKTWLALKGCPLSIGESKSEVCKNPLFNFFPTSQDAILEWSEESASSRDHVAAEKGEGAVVDVAQLPYLNHQQAKLRPTLFAFEVTGHVMLGILYNKEYDSTWRGPEIHILNPWNLGSSQQIKDVYKLVEEKLGFRNAKNVTIVDVTAQLEDWIKRTMKQNITINFQAYEKEGFCTLWVGIFAGAVIPFLQRLDVSVKKHTALTSQLNDETLNLYHQVYDIIGRDWINILRENIPKFGEERCMPTASAAMAVMELASRTATAKPSAAGKRKPRRQTKRRPLFRKRWTRKHRNPR